MIDIKDYKVMKTRCPTCPFGEKGERDRCQEIADRVRVQAITTASQICHHPELHGKPQTHLCRGARNFQLQIFHRLGVIDAETDEAWEERRSKTKNT